MLKRPKYEIKSRAQLEIMREAGLVVAHALQAVSDATRAGITTLELDAIAETAIRDSGATPSFIEVPGYHHSICVSVNDEVVHGIPGKRVLKDGDLVSIDCGAIVRGWHGDAAVSVGVGELSPEAAKLSKVTEDSMWAGLRAARIGNRLSDIGAAVEGSILSEDYPYGIVRDYVGHGIGTSMHMPPNVPNFGKPGKGPELVAGMALAIEPMIVLGDEDTAVLDDDWTVVTDDGKWAAHWEHTVAITPDGPWVLTAIDGGASRLT